MNLQIVLICGSYLKPREGAHKNIFLIEKYTLLELTILVQKYS